MNIFTSFGQIVIVFAAVACALIVFALVIVVRKRKGAVNSTQRTMEIVKGRKQEETVEAEPVKPKRMVDLKEIKGIGSRTAQKLNAAGINAVSDLAASSATALSQKTGLSEKSLTKWIEQAKRA